ERMKKGEERKGERYKPRIEGGGGRLVGSSRERLEEERKKHPGWDPLQVA
ncbi:hypothetical protein C7212DRAFT_313722, partial [Tuber magnatum]